MFHFKRPDRRADPRQHDPSEIVSNAEMADRGHRLAAPEKVEAAITLAKTTSSITNILQHTKNYYELTHNTTV